MVGVDREEDVIAAELHGMRRHVVGMQHVGQCEVGLPLEFFVVKRRLKTGDEAAPSTDEPPHDLRGPCREARHVGKHQHSHAVQVRILQVIFREDADGPMLFENRRNAPSVCEK